MHAVCLTEKGKFGEVNFGDNAPYDSIEKRDFELNLANASCLWFKGVRHVPNLKRDLISVSHLVGSGINITFTTDTWRITSRI